MKRRIDWALVMLGLALLIGGYFRLYDLTSQSLFLDEGFTFMVAGKPWPQMMHEIVYHDFHPPLFYVLTHFALGSLRWEFWDYRYLTAPFGLLTIVAAWAIARRLFGDAAASITALLVALEPSMIQWDRLYRMYGVLTGLSALSWWLMLIALDDRTGRKRPAYWALYALTAVVLPFVHYLGAAEVLAQGLYALSDIRRRWPILAAGAASVAALAPWAWAIRIQYPNGGYVAGSGTVPIGWFTLARDTLLSGLPHAWAQTPGASLSASAAVVVCAAYALWRWPKTIIPYWLGVGALQVVATLATGKALVVPRYLLPVVPALAIAAGGLTAAMIASRARIAGAAAAVALPALLALCAVNVVWDPFYQFPDWYLVNLIVLQHERPGDAMLFVQGFPYIVVGDYTAFRGRPAAGPAMPEDLPATFAWLDRHAGDRVWYIENQYFYPDPRKSIKARLDRSRRVVTLAGGKPAIWSEARELSGDVVNVILYAAESPHGGTGGEDRAKRPGPVRALTSSPDGSLDRAVHGH